MKLNNYLLKLVHNIIDLGVEIDEVLFGISK